MFVANRQKTGALDAGVVRFIRNCWALPTPIRDNTISSPTILRHRRNSYKTNQKCWTCSHRWNFLRWAVLSGKFSNIGASDREVFWIADFQNQHGYRRPARARFARVMAVGTYPAYRYQQYSHRLCVPRRSVFVVGDKHQYIECPSSQRGSELPPKACAETHREWCTVRHRRRKPGIQLSGNGQVWSRTGDCRAGTRPYSVSPTSREFWQWILHHLKFSEDQNRHHRQRHLLTKGIWKQRFSPCSTLRRATWMWVCSSQADLVIVNGVDGDTPLRDILQNYQRGSGSLFIVPPPPAKSHHPAIAGSRIVAGKGVKQRNLPISTKPDFPGIHSLKMYLKSGTPSMCRCRRRLVLDWGVDRSALLAFQGWQGFSGAGKTPISWHRPSKQRLPIWQHYGVFLPVMYCAWPPRVIASARKAIIPHPKTPSYFRPTAWTVRYRYDWPASGK